MAEIMQRVRAKYAWFLESMRNNNVLHMYRILMDGARERLEQREETLEAYKRRPPLMDRLTGKMDLTIAELELEVQEAQHEYNRYALPYEQEKNREEALRAAETPGELSDLRAEAEQDPANARELSFLNARMCALSVEVELMELQVDLESLQEEVEEMETCGSSPDRETISLYKDILEAAEEIRPYVETFQAEMDAICHPWRMPDFFRDPHAMSPASSAAIAQAAREAGETFESMMKTVEFLVDRFPALPVIVPETK